jgi:TonB family protein
MMRKIAIFFLFMTNLILSGQVVDTAILRVQGKDSTMEIIDYLESAPIFPGGDKEIWCFFESNFRYDILNITNLKATYFVKFIVDTTGYTSKIEFISTKPHINHENIEDSLIKKEIVRVFHLMPKWIPAKSNGTKVPCPYVLAFDIPYNKFKCNHQKKFINVEYKPDSPAEFIEGSGKTGYERMTNFIKQNLKWPSQDDCQGRVFISCIVDKSGKANHFEYIRRLDPDFDEEAMRVVKSMPRWRPAMKNNKKVNTIIVIPVTFKILNE